MHFPGYSEDAARFLAEGRNALGLGIDTANLDRGSAKILPSINTPWRTDSIVLTNVANLDRMPANGAVAMVAPDESCRRIGSAGADSGPGQVIKPAPGFQFSSLSSLLQSASSAHHLTALVLDFSL